MSRESAEMPTDFARRAAFCAAGLLLVAACVAMSRQAQPVTLVSDTAVIESYTVYASRGELWVGPYSRYGWHHPGPLYFYVLAPFYALSGQLTSGLNAGALLVNLASVAVLAWVVARAAGGALAMVTTAMVALYGVRLAPMLVSPWNPHVIVLPTLALVVIAAAVVSGWTELLPLAAVMATFVAQTHLGVVPSACVMSAIALAAVVRSAASERDPARRQHHVRVLSVTLCVLVVLWAMPLWEEVTRTPGNLTRIWRFFWDSHRASQPFKSAYAAWTDMVAGIVRADLQLAEGALFRRSRIAWAEGWAGAQMLLLGVVAIVAGRAGRRFGAALPALLVVGSVTALWSATRIDDAIVDHEVFWMSAFGVLGTAVLVDRAVAALWGRVEKASPHVTSIACVVAVCALAAVGLYQLSLVKNRTGAPRPQQVAAATLADALTQRIRATTGRPLVKIEQDAWPIAAGVLLNLQKAGLPFAVDADWLPMFTEAAAATGRETEVVEIVGRERHFLLTSGARAVTLAAAEPFYLLALPPPEGR